MLQIGLDFDGVIANCGETRRRVAHDLFDVEIPAEKLRRRLAVEEGYLTEWQWDKVRKETFLTDMYNMKMEPVGGALDHIKALLTTGRHDVRVITSRDNVSLALACRWIFQRDLILPFTGVGRGASKAEAARGLDVYIDDDLEKLEEVADVVPHRFLFSWPYNEHEDEGDTAIRVRSWDEFVEHINAFS